MIKWLKFSLLVFVCGQSIGCKQSTSPQDNISSKKDSNLKDTTEVLTNHESKTQDTLVVDRLIKDYDEALWAEIVSVDSMTVLDLKYATVDNFTKQQIYDCGRCFLRPIVHEKLLAFREHMIQEYNVGIILYDCYRPRPYQQKLWDIVPDPRFVGNPAKGSMHNRGMAVDIGLIDMDGNILDMGSDFDHFGRESFHSATNISKAAIKNRKLLKSEIGKFGFKPITSEWWHYSYREDIGALSDWLWACH